NNHRDFQHCLFAYFLSQIEPKKISQALEYESWVDAMQKELLQFKTKQVWILADLPFGKKARLVSQGHRQEERIDYDEVFAPVARIEAIRIFLAFASYMGLIVYQMDVKSAFLYGKINKEVYVFQPSGFIDPKFPKKSWCDEFEALMKRRFQMSYMGELTFFLGLQVKQNEDGIFISQEKYVAEILKKFNFMSVKTASTLIEIKKPLVKDAKAADMERIFRYLKGQPKLGLWYPRESAFDLKAYSDSDYAGANLDRKSITGVKSWLVQSKRLL
nr:putative ribonuclease H-like domain-containing protein [Tanacetum cinerariifolium]